MKKILSLVLALVMTISCASFAFAAPAIDEDAKDLSVYQESIDFLAKYDIYNGDMTDTDAANDVLRWHMALFVARITTGWVEDSKWEGSIENYSGFSDIDTDLEKYLGAISYASQMGIIEGYGDGRFGPKDGIKYQDALKMLCCALGYTKVDGGYPWGYIQKAVNLGLTNVIGEQGLAPTDLLCRAEVGQLIYNALFVETTKGDTLAQRCFGADFVWENVMITKTDKVSIVPEETVTYAAAGKVGFSIIEDGKLDATTYYATEKAFGLDSGVEAELAVGTTYKVLFEVKDYVANVVDAIPYDTDTLTVRADKGDTTAKIKNYVEAIEGFQVQKFGEGAKYVTYTDAAGTIIAVDWFNGHILTWNAKEEVWEVEWYYNQLLNKYFQVVEQGEGIIDGVIEDVVGETVGIKFMTEADAAELRRLFNSKIEIEKEGLGITSVKLADALKIKDGVEYAYADLDIIDTVGEGFDRGYVKTYSFGKITTKDCAKGKCELITIENFTTLYGAANTTKYIDVRACGCDDCGDCADFINSATKFGWINATEATFENGKYAIYSYNPVTGEIEIIRTEKSNNFEWLKNVKVNTYNTKNGKVTLDGVEYSYGYAELPGVMFNANQQQYSQFLYDNFNQYVDVLLIDGKVVVMNEVDNSGFEYIIVESYAGISDEGFIVVNGYNTKDLVYDQFLIESYNGWKQGDYFYNLSLQKVVEAFNKGAIYTIKSTIDYKGGELLYNVEIADTIAKSDVDLTIECDWATKYGYIVVTEGNEDGKLVNDAIKVVIIDSDNPFQLTVFNDKVTNSAWSLEASAGTWAKIDGAYVIFADAPNFSNEIVGFGWDQSDVSLVVYTDSYNTFVDYDGTTAEDWYILGSTKYTTKAFDLLAGKNVDVYGYNLKLEVGKAYFVVNGQIINSANILSDIFSGIYDGLLMGGLEQLGDNTTPSLEADELAIALEYLFHAQYTANNIDNTKYIIGSLDDVFNAEENNIWKDGALNKGLFSMNEIYPDLYNTDADAPEVVKKSFVDGVTLFTITSKETDSDELLTKQIKKVSDNKISKLPDAFDVEENTYDAFYIYDVANKTVLVYVCDWSAEEIEDEYEDTNTSDENVVIGTGVIANVTTDPVYGEINIAGTLIGSYTDVADAEDVVDKAANDYYTIEGIELVFDGDLFEQAAERVNGALTDNAVAAIEKIINKGWYFGLSTVNGADVTYSLKLANDYGDAGTILGSIVAETYENRAAVSKVRIMFNNPIQWMTAWQFEALTGSVVIDFNRAGDDSLNLDEIWNLDYNFTLDFVTEDNTATTGGIFVLANGAAADSIDLPGIRQ